MIKKQPLPVVSNEFEILFKTLEEAKNEQGHSFQLQLESVSDTNNTVMLFKDFQESLEEASYTTFTKA